ncbi:hypothetical protein NIES4071_98770 [Calothrix sp. NIES-4071]|nr:hypothetical protein NIES4071_98770 [Calothrix sp. NIES-4071]BAZ64141.1 hypothetical protein NIES4105_98700 [Calothrix sp. NIES-4105]
MEKGKGRRSLPLVLILFIGILHIYLFFFIITLQKTILKVYFSIALLKDWIKFSLLGVQ